MNNWTDRGLDAAYNIFDYAQNLVDPTLKLGVTGLSRSGKTVFITSLIYHLLNRSQLNFFEPQSSGRILDVYLEPHPNDLLPRFDYEGNLNTLTNESPCWPEGTRYISQLRLTVLYQSDHFLSRHIGPSKLHIDIIDYPGEWLLDLPLLEKDYNTWSKETLAFAKQPHAAPYASEWLEATNSIPHDAVLDEGKAKELADLFTTFLKQTRQNSPDLPAIPPGRFLMPGDLKDSPALTFAPMIQSSEPTNGTSLKGLMQRRYEAYKSLIIRPFYRQFFTRLDRQIVLVDVLSNLNAGKTHINQLQSSLSEILKSFSPGASHWLTSIWNKKIDRLVFAATKADHLHHHNHDQLQNLLKHLTQSAIDGACLNGADVKVQALASLRTTREVTVEQNKTTYQALAGTPQKGTVFQGKTFDGKTEAILFPGELPNKLSTNELATVESSNDLEIINFAPPFSKQKNQPIMPHIRLDRALNMLIGDKLR